MHMHHYWIENKIANDTLKVQTSGDLEICDQYSLHLGQVMHAINSYYKSSLTLSTYNHTYIRTLHNVQNKLWYQ